MAGADGAEDYLHQLEHEQDDLMDFLRDEKEIIDSVESSEKKKQRFAKNGMKFLGDLCDDLEDLQAALNRYFAFMTTELVDAQDRPFVSVSDFDREIEKMLKADEKHYRTSLVVQIHRINEDVDLLYKMLESFRNFRAVSSKQVQKMQDLFVNVLPRKLEALKEWRSDYETLKGAVDSRVSRMSRVALATRGKKITLSRDQLSKIELMYDKIEDLTKDEAEAFKKIFWIDNKTKELIENFMGTVDSVRIFLSNALVNINNFSRLREQELDELHELLKKSSGSGADIKRIQAKNRDSLLKYKSQVDRVFQWLGDELTLVVRTMRQFHKKMQAITIYEKKLFSILKHLEDEDDVGVSALKDAMRYAHLLEATIHTIQSI